MTDGGGPYGRSYVISIGSMSPDRQVEFDRSSSPTALNEGDRGRLEAGQAVKEFVEQEIQ